MKSVFPIRIIVILKICFVFPFRTIVVLKFCFVFPFRIIVIFTFSFLQPNQWISRFHKVRDETLKCFQLKVIIRKI